MELKTIARATVWVGLVAACGAGGEGSLDLPNEPGGPFSGAGNPGSSIYRNPGVFSGSGSPGVTGTTDINGLIANVCLRASGVCPGVNADPAECTAFFRNQWDRLTTECARGVYHAFLTCLLSASYTCNAEGQTTTDSCEQPSYAQCGGPTGGTGGAGGGGGAGGTGGTGGGNTGGTAATGGSGGNTGGSGGTTGGSGGGTGGSGGSTGGTGGTGGRGGRGGGGGRDGGRG
jgi:hypothetical protein